MNALLIAERIEGPKEAKVSLPARVVGGSYNTSVPLIRRSRLTTKSNGGVGKQLSDGWCLNFAVGCSHACPFCYVDGIHKRFGSARYGEAVQERWGNYLLVPSNLDEAIDATAWEKWRGKEVMMSSTHDPYLPILARAARRILEHALPSGVEVCLQTRSFLVTKDLDFLSNYGGQVRLQVSIATMDRSFARLIEPRVPPPEARIEVLRQAKEAGIRVGVILAPIFPPCTQRPDVIADIGAMAQALEDIQPDHIYGESVHVRGQNLRLLEAALGESIKLTPGFDRGISKVFHQHLGMCGLKGIWWPA